MLLRLLGGHGEEEKNLDHVAVEPYAGARQAQDHLRAAQTFRPDMRERDLIADVAVAVGLSPVQERLKLRDAIRERRAAQDLGQGARESAAETDDDFFRLEDLYDHVEPPRSAA